MSNHNTSLSGASARPRVRVGGRIAAIILTIAAFAPALRAQENKMTTPPALTGPTVTTKYEGEGDYFSVVFGLDTFFVGTTTFKQSFAFECELRDGRLGERLSVSITVFKRFHNIKYGDPDPFAMHTIPLRGLRLECDGAASLDKATGETQPIKYEYTEGGETFRGVFRARFRRGVCDLYYTCETNELDMPICYRYRSMRPKRGNP